MNTQPDFRKSHPRITEPPAESKKLSEKLRRLAASTHQANAWWVKEIKELIPEAERLEARGMSLALQGLLAGIVVGLTLAFYLRIW